MGRPPPSILGLTKAKSLTPRHRRCYRALTSVRGASFVFDCYYDQELAALLGETTYVGWNRPFSAGDHPCACRLLIRPYRGAQSHQHPGVFCRHSHSNGDSVSARRHAIGHAAATGHFNASSETNRETHARAYALDHIRWEDGADDHWFLPRRGLRLLLQNRR